MTDQVQSAIERWAAAGVREVALKSGADVRLRMPDVGELQRRGAFPSELESIVLRWTVGESFRLTELDAESLAAFVNMRDHAIAEAVREIRFPGEEWQPIDLRPFVLDLRVILPLDDLDDIGMVVLRLKPADTIHAQNKVVRSAMSRLAETADEADREAAAPVAGDFRGMDPDAQGAAVGADGSGVRLPS